MGFLFLITVSLCLVFCIFYYLYNDLYSKCIKKIALLKELPNNLPEVHVPVLLKHQSNQIPSWLNGVMYQIGPGRFNIQQNNGSTFSIRHVFDGLPFIHRFEINGKERTVKYNSRCIAKLFESRIQNHSFKGVLFFGHIIVDMNFFQWIYHFMARVVNQIRFMLLGRACDSPDGQVIGVTVTPNFPLPSSRDIQRSKDEHVLVTKTDANALQKIHAETLEPQYLFDYSTFNKHLWGQLTSAHHQQDPITKEVFNVIVRIVPFPCLTVFKTSEDGKVTILADITQRHDNDKGSVRASYIHSFWLTKNYIIIPEAPLAFKDGGRNLLMTGSVVSSMHWDKNDASTTYCHIVRRDHEYSTEKGDGGGGGLIASIPIPAFFCFHVGNAFETQCPTTGDTLLVLDCASFSNGNIIHQLYRFGTSSSNGKETYVNDGIAHSPLEYGDLIRYKLNINKVKMVSSKTLAKNIDFLRFNQSYSMKPEHRYIYGCRLKDSTEANCLVKVDLNTLSIKVYDEGSQYTSCSEPIFVPKPTQDKEEDDGVLLSLVNHHSSSSRGNCYLVIIDAKDMKEIARINVGGFTAITFHGSFVDHEFKSVNV
ncbi:carotenoid oxygenase, partial [Cokeromyces recurvatus]|uniref:carotenoid oxygenase n=1 Tax=Cokeromyces recurvatus TaxID=90255 RepID=UPI00221F86C4